MSIQRDTDGTARQAKGTIIGGQFATTRTDEPLGSSLSRGRTPEPTLPYVIMSGGLVQDGSDGRLIIDLDILDEETTEDELPGHLEALIRIGDDLAAREMHEWSAQVEDRIRELDLDIIREPAVAVPSGTGPQTLILQGGRVQETFNASGLLIVDLDELTEESFTEERRRELLAELEAAGGADGDAYKLVAGDTLPRGETFTEEPAAYVAPDHPALKKPVRVHGTVTTWGAFLESINAKGTILGLQTDRSSKIVHLAVEGADDDSVWRLPAAVAKASGLPNITTPLRTAQVRYDAALNAKDNYERRLSMGELVAGRDEKLRVLNVEVAQAEWDVDVELTSEAGAEYAEKGPSHARTVFDESARNGHFPIGSARLFVHAALADGDFAVEMLENRGNFGRNPLADAGRLGRQMLLEHPLERVRVAAISNGILAENTPYEPQRYLATHPSPALVAAVNDKWQRLNPTGTFTLVNGAVEYRDDTRGTRTTQPVRTAEDGPGAWMKSPREREEARLRR